MDRPPTWIRTLAAICWAMGLLAATSGPATYAWHPSVKDRWLWPTQTVSTMDAPARFAPADVVVLDPFLAAERTVSDLHSRGTAAVCRLSGGIWEAGRPDQGRLDIRLVGANGWLDVRQWKPIRDVFVDRLALCVTKGFDGVVLTDLDGYVRPTGFPLSANDQRRYNCAIVDLAHDRGLRVAVVATEWTLMPATADVVVSRPR